MKIGVLYPRSKAHPGIMADFVEGIKTALLHKQLNQYTQLISESVGYGGNEKEVYEKVEKLLILEGVDVLVIFIDLRILEIIKPLLFATGKLVLVVNAGANYPENWIPQSNILNLTLQHGFLCWLTGKLIAQVNHKNAALATTFYDCGYLHTAAMVKGFVNEGGSITHNYVNNQRYDDTFEIKSLTDYLTSDKETRNLLCVFDSLPASLFYNQLKTFDSADKLYLFVSPMMLEHEALEKISSEISFSIEGYLPWHESLDNKANKEFKNIYLEQTKRGATLFSLLGWETGLILSKVFSQRNVNYTDGAELAEKLIEGKIDSPRGEMMLDPETNYFVAPVYQCAVQQNSGKLLIQNIRDPEIEWNAFVQIPTEGVSSGWTNSYLCY